MSKNELQRELADVMMQIKAITEAIPKQHAERERRQALVEEATTARDAYLASLPAASANSVTVAGGVSVAGFISSPQRVLCIADADRVFQRLSQNVDDATSARAEQDDHIRHSRDVLSALQTRASDLRHELASESAG